ncbi:hypothetical protein [Rathayibacter sp. VKM Ac-2879]|uniref:hypothetical protein n=1 Tax=unclassified Rathayibacter TaxID=2609250 RepID=UPI003A5BDA75
MPLTDQTRTTELVVLPGVVATRFGGLSPVAAGAFPIIVLAALVTSESIVAVVLLTILRGDVVKPQP